MECDNFKPIRIYCPIDSVKTALLYDKLLNVNFEVSILNLRMTFKHVLLPTDGFPIDKFVQGHRTLTKKGINLNNCL